jgi:hypothetical protein
MKFCGLEKNNTEFDEDQEIHDLRKVKKSKPQSAHPGSRSKKRTPYENCSDVMEGETVAHCEESENDNKTECISIDDVSNCSEEEKNLEISLEKAPVIITLEPNKKLSKICENNEHEIESPA